MTILMVEGRVVQMDSSVWREDTVSRLDRGCSRRFKVPLHSLVLMELRFWRNTKLDVIRSAGSDVTVYETYPLDCKCNSKHCPLCTVSLCVW